jgi:single-stranded DNA-binding protein
MSFINKVILVGKLVSLPRKKTTAKGNTITVLNISLNEKEEQAQSTIEVICWGKAGRIAQISFSQYDIVSIEGFLQMDNGVYKQTQQQRNHTRIIAEKISLVIKH